MVKQSVHQGRGSRTHVLAAFGRNGCTFVIIVSIDVYQNAVLGDSYDGWIYTKG